MTKIKKLKTIISFSPFIIQMSRMCHKQVLVTREYQEKHVFSFFELVKYIMGYTDDPLGLATLRLDITCIHTVFPANTTSILWQECSVPLCGWEKFVGNNNIFSLRSVSCIAKLLPYGSYKGSAKIPMVLTRASTSSVLLISCCGRQTWERQTSCKGKSMKWN